MTNGTLAPQSTRNGTIPAILAIPRADAMLTRDELLTLWRNAERLIVAEGALAVVEHPDTEAGADERFQARQRVEQARKSYRHLRRAVTGIDVKDRIEQAHASIVDAAAVARTIGPWEAA